MDSISTIVASGSMQIRDGGLLRAYLGSCVGLALYDPEHRRGGLAHILLPRPISQIPETHLSSYASTAVPRLIEALLSQGAKLDKLVAHIAGGALVDPLSPTDLNLNIGGRTLEITLEILKDHGIAIRHLEAAGFTPSQIIFDTSSGLCRIEPIPSQPARAPLAQAPGREEILRNMHGIMPVPQLALKISGLLSQESADLGLIAAEIKKDQVISARVLSLCNSAYVRPAKAIESIDQALLYLGSQSVLKLIMTALTQEIFSRCGQGYSLCRGGMYHHALGTARLSERLARHCEQISPDQAYTAGLLHDIGKVVLDQGVAKAQPQFYRLIQQQNKDSASLERELFGIDHTETGRLLLESWQVPEVYCAVAAGHHQPASAGDFAAIVHLVHLADFFMHKFMSGLELEHLPETDLEASLSFLGLRPEQVYAQLEAATRID